MMRLATVSPRILLTVILVGLVVSVIVLDIRRREAERRVADLLLQLENAGENPVQE